MAREKGLIKKLIGQKPFGFISRPDASELFFHFHEYPAGQKPAVGDELEYEVATDSSKPAGKRDFADNITIVKKASVSGQQPAANSAAATKQVPGLMAEFLFGTEFQDDERYSLEVRVRVTRGGKPLQFALVELRYFKCVIDLPDPNPTTNHLGEAVFLITFEKEVNQPKLVVVKPLPLAVKATFGGETISISELYPKTEVKPAELPTPPPTSVPPPEPKLTVTESDEPGCKKYTVRYGTPDALVPATFEVWPTRGCRLALCEEGQTSWQTTAGKTSFPSTGQSVFQVKMDQLAPGVGGEQIFIGVQGTTIQFGPHYISGIK